MYKFWSVFLEKVNQKLGRSPHENSRCSRKKQKAGFSVVLVSSFSRLSLDEVCPILLTRIKKRPAGESFVVLICRIDLRRSEPVLLCGLPTTGNINNNTHI